MSLRKKIKKYVPYENIRYFFYVHTDQEIVDTLMKLPMLTLFGLLGVVGFIVAKDNTLIEIGILCLFFSLSVIFGFLIKKNVERYRKYNKTRGLLIFLWLEYALMKMCCINTEIHWNEVAVISVVLWILQTAVLIICLYRMNSASKTYKNKIEKAYVKSIHKIQGILCMVGVFPMVLYKHRDLEDANSEILIIGVQIIFSVLWVQFINSILFDIIYREEINEEISLQRSNKRTIKRKKIETTKN